jgi:polyhydroxyalkanoate synthesis regulator protein
MFEQAMAMFSPFKTPGAQAITKPEGETGKTDELAELKTQLAEMQAKVDKLSRDRG